MVQNPNLGLLQCSLVLAVAACLPCALLRCSRLAAQRPSKQLSACPGIRRPSRRRVARPHNHLPWRRLPAIAHRARAAAGRPPRPQHAPGRRARSRLLSRRRAQVPAAGRRAWSWRRTRGVRPCWPLAQRKLRKIQVGLGPVGIWDFDCCWAPGPTSPAAAQVAEESSSTSRNTFQPPFLQSMASKT